MATITFRTDREVDQAIRELTADGTSASDVLRAAVLHAWREQRRAQLRADAEASMSDPDDIAEMRRLREEMDSLRAW